MGVAEGLAVSCGVKYVDAGQTARRQMEDLMD